MFSYGFATKEHKEHEKGKQDFILQARNTRPRPIPLCDLCALLWPLLVKPKNRTNRKRHQAGHVFNRGAPSLLVQDIFLNLEFVAAKINEEAMLHARGFQVTEDLGNVLI